jgi:uncharacterized protein YhbP (UPF0306 family)
MKKEVNLLFLHTVKLIATKDIYYTDANKSRIKQFTKDNVYEAKDIYFSQFDYNKLDKLDRFYIRCDDNKVWGISKLSMKHDGLRFLEQNYEETKMDSMIKIMGMR